MTDTIVIDSGALLAGVLAEERTAVAQRLLKDWRDDGVVFAAPILFRYELVATMRKTVARNRLTETEAREVLNELLVTAVDFYISDQLLKRAFEIATLLNHPTAYDSQYLAVAESLACEF